MRNILNRPVKGKDRFARVKIEKRVLRALHNGNSIALYGGYKSGKTSLVLGLEEQHEELTTRYFDLEDYVDADNPFDITNFREKVALATKQLGLVAIGREKKEVINPKTLQVLIFDNCAPLLERLQREGRRKLLEQLVEVLLSSGQQVILVLDTLPDVLIEQIGFARWFAPLSLVELAPLTLQEFGALFDRLSLDCEFRYYPGIGPKIYYYHQNSSLFFMKLLFEECYDFALDFELDRIELDHIDQIYERLVNGKIKLNFIEQVLERYFDESQLAIVKKALNVLVQGWVDKHVLAQIGCDHFMLRLLEFLGYIIKENQNYGFASKLYRSWWQTHIAEYHTIDANENSISFFGNKITIEQITLRNVKCFDNITIDLQRQHINVLLGSNAKGKTTILQLLGLCLCGVSNVPFVYSWKHIAKHINQKSECEVSLMINAKPITIYCAIDEFDNIKIDTPADVINEIQRNCLILGYGANRFIKLEDPKPYGAIEPIATLFGENGYLKHIKSSENYQVVVQHFDVIKPLVNAVLAQANPQQPVSLQSFDTQSLYFDAYSGQRLPIEALSEGFKSTFVWLFDMILRVAIRGGDIANATNINGIVLLDEVDLHLHPSWQRTILPSVSKVFPSIQFIVTTHSPFVTQSANVDYVTSLEWQDDEMVAVKKDMTTELSYGALVREVFAISSPYSLETEHLLDSFEQFKRQILAKQDFDKAEFKLLVEQISNRGTELSGVMRREIFNIERLIGEALGVWKQ